MDSELKLASELADLAASISLPPFAERRFMVKTKPDASPVTDVDRAVERALRERIRREHPEHMVIGEEAGRSGHSDWCWYLDPIDGTTRYVEGDPKWMTLIALAHNQEVVLGIVDCPALGERWWAARGHGAFHDGQPIRVSRTQTISEAVINDDWRQHIARGAAEHPLATVAAHCARVRPHQGHASLAAACGQADIAISTGSYSWDYAPLKIIVEEAGGTHTDLQGEPHIHSRSALVINGHLHKQVLSLLKLDAETARSPRLRRPPLA